MTTAFDTNQVTLIGADYSVYTRICQLALHLKGVPHTFEILDVFAEGGNEKAPLRHINQHHQSVFAD